MVLIVHMIVTRIGFWYVVTIVKMESQLSLLDSVDDCVVLVDPKTHGVVFVNQAAKALEIKAEGLTNLSWSYSE